MSKKGVLPEEFNHRHCEICGKMIPPDQKYCSAKCESIAARRRREEEFTKRLTIIALIAISLFMVISLFIGR